MIKELGQQVGNSVAGGVGAGIAGMGINMLDEALFGDYRRQNQLDQQEALQRNQAYYGKEMMNHQNKLQMEMWENTNYDAQVQQLKKAGLNPAMIYGQGQGGGVTGSGGMGSIGTGTASDESSQKRAAIENMGMGIELAMMNAQKDKIIAETQSIKANTELTGEKTTTEVSSRDVLIENIKQQGLGKWLENLEHKEKFGTERTENEADGYRNKTYDEVIWMEAGSYIQKELSLAILKTEAEIGNTEAQKLLTNNKAQGYFRELLNEIIKAEATGKQAENSAVIAQAIKLTSEFDTGEFTNWKTWVDLGIKSVGTLSNVIGKVATKGAIK